MLYFLSTLRDYREHYLLKFARQKKVESTREKLQSAFNT